MTDKVEIPKILQKAINSGLVSVKEAKMIMAYPEALDRYIENETNIHRYVNVSKAYLKDHWRTMRGRPRPHYQQFTDNIVSAIASRIGHSKMILDPMAGPMMRLRKLEHPDNGYHLVWGVEYEDEWVNHPCYYHPRLIQGDARKLPFDTGYFDAIVVSPSYGNRDTDRTGEWWDNADRKTYAAGLGRNVSNGSLCVPFEDKSYKSGHTEAWCEAVRVLKPNGMFIINVKNFIKDGNIVTVSQWHRKIIGTLIGLEEIDDTAVFTRGRMSGENYNVRAENAEKIYFYRNKEKAVHQAALIKERLISK